MNRLASARTELFDVLTTVLPGRVAPVPSAGKPYVAPYVWIDQPRLQRATIGTATRVVVATFPIWVAYDGAVKAQVVGLDDLVSSVWDACMNVPAATPLDAEPTTVDIGGGTLRATVVSVDVVLGALTLCLPAMQPVTVPPQPITN